MAVDESASVIPRARALRQSSPRVPTDQEEVSQQGEPQREIDRQGRCDETGIAPIPRMCQYTERGREEERRRDDEPRLAAE